MGAAGRRAHVAQPFVASRLERVFDECFARRWNTRLVGGADEPVYKPADTGDESHTLYYRLDYFASALHEAAHWCIAGERRRLQPDFGYWYAPEGRDAEQQRAFQAVESKPQALEWFFSRACGYRFQVSVDNLHLSAQGLPDVSVFQQRVLEQALFWRSNGLPERAGIFYTALCREFDTAVAPAQLHFTLAQLL